MVPYENQIILAFRKDPSPLCKWYEKLYIKAIKLWTKSKYFHSEISFYGTWVTSEEGKGFITKPLEPRFYLGWDYYIVNGIELDSTTKDNIQHFIDLQKGKKYDWVGIFLAQFIHLRKDDPKKWFCSEICAKILQLCGVHELKKKACCYNPGNLYETIKHRLSKIN